MINVFKYNYPHIFDNDTLTGLQFELECINLDNSVDYEEFLNIFIKTQTKEDQELKKARKSGSRLQDY